MYKYSNRVVVHRGGGTVAPENTLMGFEAGYNRGFRAVEFDVMLSKDKKPFLFHDNDLKRTTVLEGSPSELDISELVVLDAHSWFNKKYTETPHDPSLEQSGHVPTFEEVIRYCRTNSIWMNVEIKPSEGHDAETGKVAAETIREFFLDEIAVLERHLMNFRYADLSSALMQMPLMSSFSFDALMHAKMAAPEIPRAFLVDNPMNVNSKNWKEQAREIGAIAIHCNFEHLTEPLCKDIKNEGYALFAYTVNTKEEADKLAEWGVDSLCTDNLGAFQGLTRNSKKGSRSLLSDMAEFL